MPGNADRSYRAVSPQCRQYGTAECVDELALIDPDLMQIQLLEPQLDVVPEPFGMPAQG